MNIEFDAYKQKLNDCRPALDGLADSLNLEGMRNELERLHAMQEASGFWDDPEKSQKIVVKTRQTESKIEHYEKMLSNWDDLMTICEMAIEENDDSMLEELKEGYTALEEEMERESDWLAEIDPSLPLHISRYFPRYQSSLPATPSDTIHRLMAAAQRHLRFVYPGNL